MSNASNVSAFLDEMRLQDVILGCSIVKQFLRDVCTFAFLLAKQCVWVLRPSWTMECSPLCELTHCCVLPLWCNHRHATDCCRNVQIGFKKECASDKLSLTNNALICALVL